MTDRYCTTCKRLRPTGHESEHAPSLFGADAVVDRAVLDGPNLGRAYPDAPETSVTQPITATKTVAYPIDATVLEMPDLSPGRVRRDDYATSKQGARSVAYRAGSQKARLLTAYESAGEIGLTDDEAGARAGLLASCYWKRCGELRADGAIAATGATRMGAAGVERIVCRIAAPSTHTEESG